MQLQMQLFISKRRISYLMPYEWIVLQFAGFTLGLSKDARAKKAEINAFVPVICVLLLCFLVPLIGLRFDQRRDTSLQPVRLICQLAVFCAL